MKACCWKFVENHCATKTSQNAIFAAEDFLRGLKIQDFFLLQFNLEEEFMGNLYHQLVKRKTVVQGEFFTFSSFYSLSFNKR